MNILNMWNAYRLKTDFFFIEKNKNYEIIDMWKYKECITYLF